MVVKTRGRKILRDIWARKARTLLVSFSIFVGVLGVVTLTSVGELVIRKFHEDVQPEDLAMLTVFVGLPDGVNRVDNAAILENLRQYPSVTAVEGQAARTLFWRKPQETTFSEATLLLSSEDFTTMTIHPVTLIEGAYPTTGQHELAIERRTAERYNLEVGDSLVVRIFNTPGNNSANIEQTWTVSGIVFHPFANEDADANVYTTFENSRALVGIQTYNRFSVRFTDFATAQAEAEKFQDAVEAQTPYEVGGAFLEDPENSEFIQEIGQWADTMTILAIVAMIVASFLVVTVINNIVVEQRRQIGTMKSLGATQWNNFSIYAGIALTYGLLGTIPGALLGIPAGYYLAKLLAPLANLYIESFMISPLAIAVGIILGLAVPVLASIVPVFVGTRVTILQAMTDLGISSHYGKGIIARFINRLPVPISVRQALASLSQKKTRLALTGFTLTLAVGAFMGVSAVFLSLNNVIDSIYHTFNIELGFEPANQQDFDQLSALVKENVDGIKAIYPIYDSEVEVLRTPSSSQNEDEDEENFIFVTGFDTRTDTILLDLSAGEGWQNDPERPGIVLTESLIARLGKNLGDTLTLVHDKQKADFEVIGIDRFPFDRAYMHWQALAAFTSDEPGDPAPDEFWVQLDKENPTVQDVDRVISDIRQVLVTNGIRANFFNQTADAEADANLILTIGLVFNIASAIMATIGAIGLLVTLFISVFERQREIGVMRSIGASSRTIASQFLFEGILVGVVAWLFAVPLSYGISRLLKSALPLDEFELGFPIMSLLLGFVGMLVVATIASIWPSLSASRRTVSDILRYQ